MRDRLGIGCAAVAAVCVALAGCGAGGDGGSGANVINVRFSPPTLTGPVFDDEVGVAFCERATLSPVPSETPYVKFTDSGATFAPGMLTVTAVSSDTFQTCIPLANGGLSVGTHTGTLTVQICKDAACAQPYTLSSSTIPYAITMYHVVPGLPPLDAAIYVNGVAPANVNAGVVNTNVRTYSLAVRSGDLIEVDPTEPQVLAYYMDAVSISLGFAGTVPGSLRVTPQLAAGAASGSVQVGMRAADGRTIKVTINATP